MEGQLDVFDFIERPTESVTLSSKIYTDEITRGIESIFDYQNDDGYVKEEILIPKFPKEYQIGLIVGSSGSGKSTLLRTSFAGADEQVVWDEQKAIASHFESLEEASNRFGAVGLNSIPTWLKPYHALSNGEKFRADMARRLKDNAVIDEFTSVVNREVAISCSVSIEKYIRRYGLKNITFASCHDDIIPYLQPDWVYNTDSHEFFNGRYLCRPQIRINIISCGKQAWGMFRRHHYLSGELNDASVCYLGVYNDIPIAFMALLALPGKGLEHAWKEHRVVILPDYQGMGIGNAFSEAIAQAYIDKGCRYFCKTSNPRMGEHRERSPKWRPTTHNKSARRDYVNPDGTFRVRKKMTASLAKKHSGRVCYAHEYIGDGAKHEYDLNISQDRIKQCEGQMSIDMFL